MALRWAAMPIMRPARAAIWLARGARRPLTPPFDSLRSPFGLPTAVYLRFAAVPRRRIQSLSCVWGGERENRFGCLGFIGHK